MGPTVGRRALDKRDLVKAQGHLAHVAFHVAWSRRDPL
jgi:hypothetical protein